MVRQPEEIFRLKGRRVEIDAAASDRQAEW
jgi:hypothetical protein